MTDASQNRLTTLIQISKVDGELAHIAAEKKRLQAEIDQRSTALRKHEAELREKKRVLDEKRGRYDRDEKGITEERGKLVERRKALTSFTQYKVQEAAAREIDFVAQSLNAQEESLIGVLGDIESLTTQFQELERNVGSEREEVMKFEEETRAALDDLSEREKTRRLDREELAKAIDPQSLALYTRVRERFPGSAVAPVQKNLCGGCFMHLIPQVMVQISRGEALVRCPGCGRILYNEEQRS